MAIAGDFMSAASFLGISALVYTSGYDGLIYSIGFLLQIKHIAPLEYQRAQQQYGSLNRKGVRLIFRHRPFVLLDKGQRQPVIQSRRVFLQV